MFTFYIFCFVGKYLLPYIVHTYQKWLLTQKAESKKKKKKKKTELLFVCYYNINSFSPCIVKVHSFLLDIFPRKQINIDVKIKA